MIIMFVGVQTNVVCGVASQGLHSRRTVCTVESYKITRVPRVVMLVTCLERVPTTGDVTMQQLQV